MIAVYCSPGLVNMASNILETSDQLKQEFEPSHLVYGARGARL